MRIARLILLLGAVFAMVFATVASSSAPALASRSSAPPTPPAPIDDVHGLRTAIAGIESADSFQAQVKADALWKSLTGAGRVPLIIGERVFFFFKGHAWKVLVRGDFTRWSDGPSVPARRIGKTDLWMAETTLPMDARANYKFVVNGTRWVLDPGNPRIQLGGLDSNSILDMPNYTVTLATDRRAGIPTGTLSDALVIDSRNLGYRVAYRVYTPASYDKSEPLPVLYVTDGNDWLNEDFGAMKHALDNLIADERIRPVIAVFIDAREPGNPQKNRRESEFLDRHEAFGAFVADELVPAVDRTHRTLARPDGRAIQGVSFGGLVATYIAARYSDVFHNAAIFSPSYWALLDPGSYAPPERRAALQRMKQTLDDAGDTAACGGDRAPCLAPQMRVFLTAGIPDWDVGTVQDALSPAEKLGVQVRFMPTREGHTWSNWRGTLDEMLEFLFLPRAGQ